MGRNWREQPRDRFGRWYTDKKRDVRLDLRLSTSGADRLMYLANATGKTKTAVIEGALHAYRATKAAARPPEPDIFSRHREQLYRRKQGRR